MQNPSLLRAWYATLKSVLLGDTDCYSFLSTITFSISFCLCLENKEINNKIGIYRAMAEFEVRADMRHFVEFVP
jgi:hypothetical protein